MIEEDKCKMDQKWANLKKSANFFLRSAVRNIQVAPSDIAYVHVAYFQRMLNSNY